MMNDDQPSGTFSELCRFLFMAVLSMVMVTMGAEICEQAGGLSASIPPHVTAVVVFLCFGFGGCVGIMVFTVCRWLWTLPGCSTPLAITLTVLSFLPDIPCLAGPLLEGI